jgi:hypothetical protein
MTHEVTGWIATDKDGNVLHFAKATGWNVEEAATSRQGAPRPATRRSEPEGVAKYLGDKKPENTSPWPQSETPAGGTAKVLIAPRGHDEAHERINECFREIEIICDTFGYDPAQWLVIDDGDMASPQSGNEESK